MLAQFRRFAKSPVAVGLISLLLISFLVWGIRDVFNAGSVGGDWVVKAGSRQVTAQQFRKMFDRYLQGLAQQNGGQPVTIQQAAAQGLDVRALDELASDESVAALVTKLGVRPADALIAEQLRKATQFFDPVTGRFDKRAYQRFLAENQITAAELEGSLRDQIAQQHFISGLVAGMEAPFAFTAVQAVYNDETRGFAYAALTPNLVPKPAPPTDAELQQFMRDNAQAFLRPETRTVSLVRFSAAQLAPTVKVDPADLQKRFDFEKDSLSVPEKRSLVEIPLKSAGQAAQVAAALQAGRDPAAVAKSVGTQPVVLTDQPATAIPDRAVADAAFAMKPGEVRTVSGGLAPAVVKLNAVTPGHAVTLDEVRPKITEEAQRAAAAAKAQDLATKYDDARAGGATLPQAAQKLGVPVTQLPAFDAQGRDAKGQHVPAPEKLIQTAFSLKAGGESDVLQAAPGEWYAIRVDQATPPSPVPLDEVRAPLVQRLTLQKLARELQAKAEAITAQAKKTGDFEGAVRAAGATVQHAADVGRTPKTPQTLPGQPPATPEGFGAQLLGAVFGAKRGDVVSAPDKLSIVVARVDAINTAPAPVLARDSAAARDAASLGLYEDLAVHARDAAREEVRPRIDQKRARAALGLDPAASGAPVGPAS